jgi:hypothetical protein
VCVCIYIPDIYIRTSGAHKDDTDLLRELLFLVSNMAQSPELKTSMAQSGTVERVPNAYLTCT